MFVVNYANIDNGYYLEDIFKEFKTLEEAQKSMEEDINCFLHLCVLNRIMIDSIYHNGNYVEIVINYDDVYIWDIKEK